MFTFLIIIFLPILNSQLIFPENTNVGQQSSIIINKTISEGIVRLTLAINKANNSPNIVFAPFSISVVLGLLLLASQAETFNEIATLLSLITKVDIHENSPFIHETYAAILEKLQSPNDNQQQVTFASGIFVQKQIRLNETYIKNAKSLYNAEILNVNFENSQQTQQIIDNWVNEGTRGKIGNISSFFPLPSPKMIIANAMYFKANWETPFKPQFTKKRRFYTNGFMAKIFIRVDMMQIVDYFSFYQDDVLDCKILAYPYKGREFIMYVILPIQSTRAKLKDLESKLDNTEIDRLIENLQKQVVTVLLPKMNLESSISLKRTLQLLGLESLFDPGKANLSQLTDNSYSGLFAEEIIHKVSMDITETGTEAASTTFSVLPLSRPSDFKANVPFLYFIRHEPTKTIQFWGSITIPTPNFM